MARLKRKRPASTKKKKKQKGAPQTHNRQSALNQEEATMPTVQKPPAQNRQPAPRSEAVKAIKPSGLTFQPAFLAKTGQFLREVKIELKKVTWPSRKETLASTVVVIVIVVIIAAFLGLVDMGLSNIIRFVLK